MQQLVGFMPQRLLQKIIIENLDLGILVGFTQGQPGIFFIYCIYTFDAFSNG